MIKYGGCWWFYVGLEKVSEKKKEGRENLNVNVRFMTA